MWKYDYVVGEEAGPQLRVEFRFPDFSTAIRSGAGERDYPCTCTSYTKEVKGTPGYVECIHYLLNTDNYSRCRTHRWIYEMCTEKIKYPIAESVMK
jgi:hypothetical protein